MMRADRIQNENFIFQDKASKEIKVSFFLLKEKGWKKFQDEERKGKRGKNTNTATWRGGGKGYKGV